MAYKTVATRWLISKKELLAVSFVEHKDSQGLLTNMTDIEVKVSVGDLVFSGRGTDPVGDIALEKASSEAIERWCCHLLGISTVGCAIHSIQEHCMANARNEFLERYFFNQVFSKSISPCSLKSEPLGTDTVIKFFEITKCDAGSVLLALIFDSCDPICLGLSLESDIDLGFKKASIEALRNYSVYKTDKVYFQKTVASDHNLWCCDPQLLSKITKTLSSVNTPVQSVKIPEVNSWVHPVSEIIKIIDCPLYFSRTVAVGDL
jgi:hypothetical protein